jgi:hypothetical protein
VRNVCQALSCVLAISCATGEVRDAAAPAVPNPPASPAVVVDGRTLPAEELLEVRNDAPIATDRAKAGDLEEATVQTRVVDREGRRLLASPGKVVLHVDQSLPGRGVIPGRLELSVAGVRGGCPGSAVAIGSRGSVEVTDTEQVATRPDNARQGRGALAGLVLGSLLLGGGVIGVQGAIVGYDVGKDAALIADVTSRQNDARIPPGTKMWVRLNRPIPLAALGCPTRHGPT